MPGKLTFPGEMCLMISDAHHILPLQLGQFMTQTIGQHAHAGGVEHHMQPRRGLGMAGAEAVHFRRAAVQLLNIHLANLTHAPAVLDQTREVQREKGFLRVTEQQAIKVETLPLLPPALVQREGKRRAFGKGQRLFA